MTRGGGGAKWLARAGVAALVMVALAPFAVVTDVPGVDQGNHMASIAAWNHVNDPSYGMSDALEASVRPDPYFAYYAFVHYLSYVMPIRWANKAFHVVSVLALALGMLAFLRAHGRPPVLALAALPLAWNYNMGAGFITTIFGSGVLLFAFARLARLEDAGAAAPRRAWVAGAALGFALYLSHFLAWMVWAPVVLLRLRWRGLWLVVPSAPLFLIQGDRPDDPASGIAGSWIKHWPQDFPDQIFEYVSWPEKAVLLAGLVAAIVIAWRLVERAPGAAVDRRPLVLAAIVAALFFALPFSVHRPFYWSNINVRLPPLAMLIGFACVPRGTLAGRRALIAVAPIAAVLALDMALIVPRWMAYERRAQEFYEVVRELPRSPDVLVLIPDTNDVLRRRLWKEQGAYIAVDKGGLSAIGFRRGFPVRVKPGKDPLLKLGDRTAAHYEWVVTRDGPKVRSALRGFTLSKRRGPWALWKRDAAGGGEGGAR